MAERSLIVGSLPDCDVRVENPLVSGRHCRLTQRGSAYLLEDLQSTNGTFVAGERITGPRIVERGAVVTLGRNESLPWHEVPVYATIGRAPDNDVVIPFEAVSANHARIERRGQQVFLVDLNSTNGTSLNDPQNKITRAPLSRRDAVYLGSHRVAAADLLAALPEPEGPASTLAERSLPDELAETTATSQYASAKNESPALTATWSARSWIIGGVLSVVVVVIAIASARLLRRSDEAVAEATRPTSASVDPEPAPPAAGQPALEPQPEQPTAPQRAPSRPTSRTGATSRPTLGPPSKLRKRIPGAEF